MNKKARKAARELQRLQALYQRSQESAPIGVPRPTVSANISADQSAAVLPHSHAYVKRDLLLLLILIIVMIALLVGLNLLAEKTAFGEVLAKLVGRIF